MATSCQSERFRIGVRSREEKEKMSLRKHKRIDYSKLNGEDSISMDATIPPKKKVDHKRTAQTSTVAPVPSKKPSLAKAVAKPVHPITSPFPVAYVLSDRVPYYYASPSQYSYYAMPSSLSQSIMNAPSSLSQSIMNAPSTYVQPAYPLPYSSSVPLCVVPTPMRSLPVPTKQENGLLVQDRVF